MNEVVIVAYARTPLGSFNGGLSSMAATTLGGLAIKGALSKISTESSFDAQVHVDEVLMGCVLQGNLGQAPARQAALAAGLPTHVACTAINKVCASSMKALAMATASIQVGNADCIVVGGMESMSQCPYYVANCRKGMPFGDGKLVDGINRDGLLDAYDNSPMGIAAELCASTHGITREQQDEYTINSFTKAANAWSSGVFDAEVVPVEVRDRRGAVTVVTEDETVKTAKFDKIPKLKPCFKDDGSVTAASSSPLSDGACALVLMSASRAKALNVRPLARIVGSADATQAPELFTTSPSLAIPKAVAKAGLTMADIKYFEINEAFSVVALANMKLMNLSAAAVSRVNIYGGAVAMGHPLGCSGARIVCTLLTALSRSAEERTPASPLYGCASICNGGGGASALVIEKI